MLSQRKSRLGPLTQELLVLRESGNEPEQLWAPSIFLFKTTSGVMFHNSQGRSKTPAKEGLGARAVAENPPGKKKRKKKPKKKTNNISPAVKLIPFKTRETIKSSFQQTEAVLTIHSFRTTSSDVKRLHEAKWNDPKTSNLLAVAFLSHKFLGSFSSNHFPFSASSPVFFSSAGLPPDVASIDCGNAESAASPSRSAGTPGTPPSAPPGPAGSGGGEASGVWGRWKHENGVPSTRPENVRFLVDGAFWCVSTWGGVLNIGGKDPGGNWLVTRSEPGFRGLRTEDMKTCAREGGTPGETKWCLVVSRGSGLVWVFFLS